MKTIIIEKINSEVTKEVLEALYSEDKLIIILECSGGSLWATDILIKELNKQKEKVIMYGCEMLSAGFDLFNGFEGEKYLTDMANVMIHKADTTCDISWGVRTKFLKRIEDNNELYRAKVKSFLTKEELKQYDRGEEVWIIDEDRQKLIFGL